MNETLVLPEMLEAGLEAFKESKSQKFTEAETVVAVFMAMRVVEEIYSMRRKADVLD